MTTLRAPFPYYGSKVKAAQLIEALMGPINNLVIPFAGSLGELLGRSEPAKVETVNDLDGFVVNAWRGLKYSPAAMAELCDHPVHEATMHSAHELLLAQADALLELLRSHPKAHDVELAAWWVWGASCWLGSGWCRKPSEKVPRLGGQVDKPHLGLGVARPWVARPHQGIVRQLPMLSGGAGYPAHGQGVHASHQRERLAEYFAALAERLRWVRITCGDWTRVVTPAVTTQHGVTGISLDPTYEHKDRSVRLYRHDDPDLSAEVRAFAIERGDDKLLRITLCGRGEEHDETLEHGWSKHVWRERDGETIWASPHCLRQAAPPDPQGDLFERAA
jgi:DNA adenine methylase